MLMIFQNLYIVFSALALIYLARFDHYGLYIAIALFWLISILYKPILVISMWSIIIFMISFALMRIFNFVLNGAPSLYHLIILISEIIIALIGIFLVKSNN